jgi:predicted nucleic acid-binding protein
LLPRVEVDPPLRAPDDVPVVASAVAGRAQLIVTGDDDLLTDTPVRQWLVHHGTEVVTAVEVLRRLPA